MSASIQVAIKVRPLIKREEDENLPIQWSVQDKCITPLDPELKKRGEGGFHFDHIFDMTTTTVDVFNTIAKPIVEAAVNGFNGTIFAYGQTSSGKTYTMMGTRNEPGVIPLSVIHIFNLIQNSDRQFLLRVSYIEIYNERVNDLLDPDGTDLRIKDDAKGQAFVHCKEELVNSPERVLDIMKKGDKNRRIGETNMNERSSRSHTILRITIESREASADDFDAIQVSQLNLVDLAGSERAGQTGAIGTRFKEGTHINMSLSALGLVILQLSESQDNPKVFVNFRDSKLTRILQPSLGGNAMTTIICAVTPAAVEETQCTLAFASRAKRIKNKPKLNEELSEAALLKRYAKHISKLETELKKVKSADVVEMESKLLEKERANQILEERIELLKNSILCGNSASGKEDVFKSEAKRRRTWGGHGTLGPKTPIFQKAIGLPTIIESDRTPEKKEHFKQHSKGRQSILVTQRDIANEIFQLEFPDFEKELIARERERVNGRPSDASSASDQDDDYFITKRTVMFCDDVSVHSSARRSLDSTVEPKSPGQYDVERALPETPKAALRKKISILMEQYNSLSEENGRLMEFTRLERQMIVDEEVEKAMAEHNEKLAASEHIICELNDKYTKLQIHSTETDRLLADSNDRLSELERQMAESINSLRVLRCEKQALVDELNKHKRENQESLTSLDNREDKEMSVFENASYFDEMNLSDLRADSILVNDTQNTQDLTMNETNIANMTANTTVTNDVREVKFLAEKLKETVQLLTVENTEVTNKLANEKERANKNEKHLQDTISELLTKIHAITEEKNLLKNAVWELEHRLQKTDADGSINATEDETAKSIENYRATVASLTAENIELSTNLMNKIEELDRVKDLKSASCNHDCEYRELSANLSEKNKLLEKENIELSNDLMEKIEEHDHLRENFKALKCKLASLTSQESSNNLVETPINSSNLIEKEKSECPSGEFVDDLLQLSAVGGDSTCDTNENGHPTDEPTVEKVERSNGSEIGIPTIDELLQTSIIPNGKGQENVSNDNLSNENDSSWKIKAKLLAEQVVQLRRLNEKLKDLKRTSCKQCSYITDLNENRRALRGEVKEMNRKLVKLQEEFDRECADSEILRTKANEELNLTVCDSTMNESSMLDSSFSVSVLEDRVQRLRHELDTLKDKYGKLSDDYNEKCDEIEKLQDVSSREATPTESPRVKCKDNKYVKLETDLENLKTDLRRLKKAMAAVSANLQKISNDKTIMSNEIESLKAEKRELQGKFSETVDPSITEERIRSLQIEVSRLNEEVDTSNAVKEELLNTKAALEAEVSALKSSNQSFEVTIANMKSASGGLERNVSLEKDIVRLTEEVESLNAVKEDLQTAKLSLEAELSSLRANKESFVSNIPDTEDTSTFEEKIKHLENDVARLSKEIEIFKNSNEELESAKLSLEAEVRSLQAAKKTLEVKLGQIEIEMVRLHEQVGNSNEFAERELENEKSLLNAEVRSLQAAKESLEEKLGHVEIEVARLNEQISSSNVAELENERSLLDAEVRSLQAAKESLEEKLGHMETEVARLNEQINSSNVAERELENEKSLLDAEVRSLQAAKELLEEKLSHMEIEVARLNEQISSSNVAERALENAKSSLEAEVRTLQAAKESLEDKLGQMEIEVARLHKQIGDSNIAEREQKDTKSFLNAEIRSLLAADEPVEENLDKMEIEVARLSEQISTSNIAKRELETVKALLVDEIRLLQAAKESLGSKFSKSEESSLMEEKMSVTEAELNAAQSQLKYHSESLNELVTENASLKKKLTEFEESVEELTSSKLLLNNEVASLRTEITKLESSLSVLNQRLSDEKSETKVESFTDEKCDLLKEEKTIDALNTLVRQLTIEIDRYAAENDELIAKVSKLENTLEKQTRKSTENNSIAIEAKLREEVTLARECIMKEIKSMKPDSERQDLNEKSISELFCVFLREVMSKEKEIVKMLSSSFEEKKRKLEDSARQSVDAEKRTNVWAKELEADIERTQQDLHRQEAKNAELNSEIARLKNHLMESSHENKMLKEKMNVLELDFNTLQADLENSSDFGPRSGSKQNTTLNTTQQERERLIEETLTTREMELSSKLRLAEKQYKEKLEELTNSLESYKIQNMELTNNLEALKINEKELRIIVDTKSNDLVKCNNTIERIQIELEHLTEKHNNSSSACDEKSKQLEEITLVLKNKCDMLSEYKTKLETMTPEYELLKDQATERNMRLEKCKSEIERMAKENEKLTASLREKLDSEEIKTASYGKQLADLTNRNTALQAELDELKNVVETKSSELEKRNNTIEMMQSELAHLTEKHDSLSRDREEKSRRVDEITLLLKNKCDKLTEYKLKLETVTPEYELLKNQVTERNIHLEKYKSEIDRMTKDNEAVMASLSEKLASEEMKSAGYRKELADLTNRNTALQMELDELRTKCDELELTNGKLTKTLRNRTSGIRAEEEMEDLRDSNRTLQQNLDGAANRIAELQEMRTQTMKELAELRGIYEIVCNENTEMKYTLSVHRSSVNDAIELRGKYELLLQEKNRVVLELEDKKTKIVMLERELESRESENEELKSANKELDEEIEDMVKKIHELTKENAELDDKLYLMSTRTSGGEKCETNGQESEIEKLKSHMDRLRGELAVALKTSEFSRSDPLSCDSSRSGSPALEQEATRVDNRRRRSRTELFNQKRQLEVFVEDEKFPWGEGCRCVALEKKVRQLEHELVSKNGEVAALEIRIQSENFPYIKKAKDLEELLDASKRRAKMLEAELLKLRELKYSEMSSECSKCKQWEANKRDQSSQCMPENAMIRMHGTSSGIVEERIKMEKREKIIDTLKDLCRTRQKNIRDLERKNNELEKRVKELDTILSKTNLPEDDKSELSSSSSHTATSRLDSGRAMKENVPMTQDVQRPANHLRPNWFNNS